MRVVSIAEISARLNVCSFTVYRLLKSGKLPANKVGGRWYCTEDGLKRFLTPKAQAQ
jgi:excisionase family DNA binding protein